MYTWYLSRLRKLQPSTGYQTIFIHIPYFPKLSPHWNFTNVPFLPSSILGLLLVNRQNWRRALDAPLWKRPDCPQVGLEINSSLVSFYRIFPRSWKWIIKPWHICSVAALERTRLQVLYDTTHIHPGPYTITSIPVTGLHECPDKSSLCNSTQVLRFLWVCDYLL